MELSQVTVGLTCMKDHKLDLQVSAGQTSGGLVIGSPEMRSLTQLGQYLSMIQLAWAGTSKYSGPSLKL